MPQAGEIRSNLRRATTTYDEDLAIPERDLEYYNSLPVNERTPTTEEIEGLEQQFEFNYATSKAYRWPDQKSYMGQENEDRRMVNIMHPHKFFRQLQRAGVDARIEAASFNVWIPDDETGKLIPVTRERSEGRLWLADVAVRGRIGVSAWVIDKKTKTRVRRQVTQLQYPYGPEWSLLHFDQFDVPIAWKYIGWRNAVKHLVLQEVITEAEAIKAFGPVALHPITLEYRRALYQHRIKRSGSVQ